MHAILNDREIQLEHQMVSLSLYGMGIYSSFIVHNKKVKGWDYHIERLQNDAKALLGLEISRHAIVKSVLTFLDSQENSAQITARVTIFPGDFSLGSPHEASSPQILVTGRSGSSVSGGAIRAKSVECHRPFAEHKVTNIAAAMILRGRAKAAGYDDAIFTDNGFVTEGPTWNAFFIIGEEIITPRLKENLLPGITRRIITESSVFNIKEEQVSSEILHKADAAFATNAAIGAKPIASIDGRELDLDHKTIKQVQECYSAVEWAMVA